MKIHDLTRGKYPIFTKYYKPNNEVSRELTDAHFMLPEMEIFLAEHHLSKEEAIRLLDNVPVFLVESSMANEYVAVPGEECSIRVPADRYASQVTGFDIDDWLDDMKEEENGVHKDSREWECKGHFVSDLLGVYVFAGSNSVMPCRIFIWTDKIAQYVKDNTKNNNDVEERTRVLYELVLRHEMMHLLMDVAAYGIAPCPYFSHSNPIYNYIEEALANYMALVICSPCLDGPRVNVGLKHFISSFVLKQGKGYAVGLDLFNKLCESKGVLSLQKKKRLLSIATVWMRVKAQFNYDVASLLAEIWKDCLAAEKAYDDRTITTQELESERTNVLLGLHSIKTDF